jgi:transposase
MQTKKRRTYDAEFKREAVRLVIDGGRSCASVERALGMSKGVLKDWLRAYRMDTEKAFPGKGRRRKAHAEEIERLERELEVTRKERDILKKALCIFSTEPLRYTAS